jgi:hypothetical protein
MASIEDRDRENNPEGGIGHPMRGGAPLSGTRSQTVQRLQVGLAGLSGMVLLVALASIIMERAQEAEASAVPEAAATMTAEDDNKARDPLADAGVVPDLPTSSSPTPTAKSLADSAILDDPED